MMETNFEKIIKKMKSENRIKSLGVKKSKEINDRIEKGLNKFMEENEIRHIKSVIRASKVFIIS